MRKIICACDKCGKEIIGVIYTLTCYAEDAVQNVLPGTEVASQNLRQNLKNALEAEKHLCKDCKDQLTDGLFIV